MAPAQKRKSTAAAAKPAASNGMKQGTLFSFFSKKSSGSSSKSAGPRPVTSSSTASSSSTQSSGAKAAPVAAMKKPPAASGKPPAAAGKPEQGGGGVVVVGCRIEVYWSDDDEWYAAKVTKTRGEQGSGDGQQVFLVYECDGQSEWIDLGRERYRLCGGNSNNNSKRRRIQEDDDDDDEGEMEFDDDVNSDAGSEGSAYVEEGKDDEDDDDEDDDDQWMVTDDEDGEEGSKNKKKKKTSKAATGAKVTEHRGPAAADADADQPPASTNKTPRSFSTASGTSSSASMMKLASLSFQPTPKHVTPAVGGSSFLSQPAANKKTPSSSLLNPSGDATVSPTAATGPASKASTAAGSSGSRAPPPIAMYEKGVVNPAGSHVHNHLQFLRSPKDAKGRTPEHPEYDCRTLRVNPSEWERHCGKMTAAVQQWWDLKAQYFDTVLLFKTGKFYEIFHQDADIAVQVCGLLYMKGHVAHAGYPEISYGPMADKLVRAGYKVARVEQTETVPQLAERKKKHKGKGAPKVVNREVCSIMSLGTRTFCYLDDEKGLLDETSSSSSPNAIGPLLAIREVVVESSSRDNEDGDENMEDGNSNNNDDESSVRPACEYGITLIDAVRGSVTIGQFADDVLRSRMNTLLTAFCPSEILVQGGEEGASPALQSMLRSLLASCKQSFRLEFIRSQETFPKSTALDPAIRRQLERAGIVHPWDAEETLREMHHRRYYPQASKKQDDGRSVSRWPQVLRACVEGEATLALSSFGAALFYLQRNLIDRELLSMGIVKAYIPPPSTVAHEERRDAMDQLAADQGRAEAGVDDPVSPPENETAPAPAPASEQGSAVPLDFSQVLTTSEEDSICHLALDGTTLQNLEILANSVDNKPAGSLWSIINNTKTPHGSRLLRAWLLRPLFRKAEIDRRADAVEELVSGACCVAASEATRLLSKCADIERLLSRVHSMSGNAVSGAGENGNDISGVHPSERAVLYEEKTYTKRKVADFSKLLNGLRQASRVPEAFDGVEIRSPLLSKLLRTIEKGGCFPDMVEQIDWFFDNFDSNLAAKGMFEPNKGVDVEYDDACDTIARIEAELKDYKEEVCNTVLTPRSLAKSSWKYINTKPDSKDRYLIELPASVAVPDDFIFKAKRGSGAKQVNKYRTAFVGELVEELEHALAIQGERKARGMQLIFAKFDSMRSLWAAASTATAMIDALQSLAKASSNAGYTRPSILECHPDTPSSIKVVQGRHPCVEKTLSTSEFVPNDLTLGLPKEDGSSPRVLLLSGVNMGGKSTCLRQTCLIAILAQIGCFVPAEECTLTPVDRIFTRLGACDRILMGQSTFFVELAETAAALRGATRRSLVIMDELGRGTSTFDGTAIASATVQHLVERSKCLGLFATHYHSLLGEWKDHHSVQLGHMECVVENGNVTSRSGGSEESNITFLYTLGEGGCPKSFGINVARLAGLPQEVLSNAHRISAEFERQVNGENRAPYTASQRRILEAAQRGAWDDLSCLQL